MGYFRRVQTKYYEAQDQLLTTLVTIQLVVTHSSTSYPTVTTGKNTNFVSVNFSITTMVPLITDPYSNLYKLSSELLVNK